VRATFDFYNTPVTIDEFTPGKPGRFPAVLALHGSAGMSSEGHLQFAQLLANQGFAVFVPHYFGPSGVGWASDAVIQREFPNWMRINYEAINYATRHESADPERIGLIGFSLGAYLALSLAVEDKRIKAVVDFFGGMPDYFVERLDGMPPVLILHGEQDQKVPVSEAHKIARVMEEERFPTR